MSLEKQIAIVTGGSRGIGKAISLALAKDGATVIIGYASNEDAAKETQKECEAIGVTCCIKKADVAKTEEVDSLTGEMTGTVASLSGRIWSGDAAKMYTGRFQGLQKDIARLSRMIRDHVANLTQIAGEYERAEQLNRQEAGALQRELNL